MAAVAMTAGSLNKKKRRQGEEEKRRQFTDS
jgi:hypothetical protein